MNERSLSARFDVVVVDDDTLMLELVKRMLKNTDYRIRLFSDETEALVFLRSNATRVLIVDHRMPRIDGLDLLGRLAESGGIHAGRVYLCSAAELPESTLVAAAALGVEAISKDRLSNREAFLGSIASTANSASRLAGFNA